MSIVRKIIPNALQRAAGNKNLWLRTNSPHILFGLGVVGVVGGAVLASRATLKLEPTLNKIQGDVDLVKAGVTEHPDYGTPELARDEQRALVLVYSRGTLDLAKLYGPAALSMAAGIACLTKSHTQLTARNNALIAAYSGLDQAFKKYRARVREEVGEEKEQDIYHGAIEQSRQIDGKDVIVKAIDVNNISPFARMFDEMSECWEKDPEVNMLYVRCQQGYFNDLLQNRGYVFLNEVYDRLGLERSQAGQWIGWRISGDPDHTGDNFIDFGIYDAYNARFVNGAERSILLDFNVDGVIIDKVLR